MKLVDIAGEIQGETELAYRFYDGLIRIVWLPKSKCQWDQDSKTMTMGDLVSRGERVSMNISKAERLARGILIFYGPDEWNKVEPEWARVENWS